MARHLARSASARAFTVLAGSITLLALHGCDAVAPAASGGELSITPIRGAVMQPASDGAVAIVANGGGLVARPDRPGQFDMAFRASGLREGRALSAAVLDAAGAPIATLASRLEASGRHAISIGGARMPAERITVQARSGGRVVATVEAPVDETGVAGGVTSFQEPTSVHYYYYEGRDGSWILGVEYDYDLQGGGPVYLTGDSGPVHADRVRFVLRGREGGVLPASVRMEGFDRLEVLQRPATVRPD